MPRRKKTRYQTTDPVEYAHIVEFGTKDGTVPARPLFQRTLEDYSFEFNKKVLGIANNILKDWQ